MAQFCAHHLVNNEEETCGNEKRFIKLLLLLLLPFYGHYTGQPVLAGISLKNWRILLEQRFTAYIPVLMASSRFVLGRGS